MRIVCALLVLAVIFLVVLGYCCCVVAGRADEMSERIFWEREIRRMKDKQNLNE